MIDYSIIEEARTLGLVPFGEDLDAFSLRQNPIQMNTDAVDNASTRVRVFEAQLEAFVARQWNINITANMPNIPTGPNLPSGYIPSSQGTPYNPYVPPAPAPPPPNPTPGPGSCFTGDTLVSVPSGDKKYGTHRRIDEMQLGDLVYAYDEDTDEVVEREVTHLHSSCRSDLVSVKTEYGDFNCSPNHRWYTKQGWKQAVDLTYDDRILGIHGLWVNVLGVIECEGIYTVFNLTVDEHCNYFVLGLLVHNFKFAGGVKDFVVPPGFYEPQNPMMIGVSSGETVNIARAGEEGGGGNYIALHAHIASDLNVPNLVDMILDELGNRLD